MIFFFKRKETCCKLFFLFVVCFQAMNDEYTLKKNVVHSNWAKNQRRKVSTEEYYYSLTNLVN
jgi:hypothetical protein